MLKGILPVRVNLARRKVPIEKVCGRCKLNEETIYHALRLCPKAAECWNKLHFEWDMEYFNLNGNVDWFAEMFKKLEQNALQQFAVAN